ncbi:MAG: hypothetical protein ACT4PL_03165 [Phycisphaerales bacterium]
MQRRARVVGATAPASDNLKPPTGRLRLVRPPRETARSKHAEARMRTIEQESGLVHPMAFQPRNASPESGADGHEAGGRDVLTRIEAHVQQSDKPLVRGVNE